MGTYTPNLNLYQPDPTDNFGDFLPEFNDNMDKLDQGGGGGGSSVSWTQIQQSGTKIAEVTINGTTQDVYAPSGGGGGGDSIVHIYTMVGSSRNRVKTTVSHVIT